jgi:hypothetical protein
MKTISHQSRSEVPADGSIFAVLAVVDSLPVRDGKASGRHSQEGFALLLGSQPDLLPSTQTSSKAANNNADARSSLIFSIPETTGSETEIGVPLANTLFHNGRRTTLFMSTWTMSRDSGELERTAHTESTSVTVRPFQTAANIIPEWNVPLVALTPPRRISAAMGNIVRQVIGEDGKAVPASRELEASVDAYLEAGSHYEGAFKVWALVSPSSPNKGSSGPETDFQAIQAAWRNGVSQSAMQSFGSYLRDGKGVCIHRVCKYSHLAFRKRQLCKHSADLSSEWRRRLGS